MPSAAAPTSARERALAAALACFVERGVLTTTIDDVRGASGVSVGALYHHFGDKQGLAAAVYVDALARYQDAFRDELERHEDAAEAVGAMVRFHLRWCARHPDLASFLFTHRAAVDGSPALTERNRAFLGAVRGWWRTHARYGALRDLEPDLVHALWLGPAQELCRAWLEGRTRRPSPAAAGELADAARRALCTHHPDRS